MKKNSKGINTRKRLLSAAFELFSQRGYRNTTVYDICTLADTNMASVNYHFGNKVNLYKNVWIDALQRFNESLFLYNDSSSPNKQLENYIETMIHNLKSGGENECFIRLYLMEILNPTGLLRDVWYEKVEPQRRKLRQIIFSLTEIIPDELDVRLCELSILSQCGIFLRLKNNDMELLLDEPLNSTMIERFSKHVFRFSLAGVREVCAK